MKKWLFIVVVLLAALLWVLFNPPADSGYLLVSWGSKTLETSLWFAGLVLVGVVVLVWICWRLLKGGVRTAKRIAEFFNPGGSERAQKRTASGLIDFIEGNWEQAHYKLLRAAPKMDVPLINYLAAARSAWELGHKQEAVDILQQTLTKVPGSELAVALTQARMELQSQHYEDCLKTLLKVKPQAPQNPVLLDLLRQVYLAREDWDGIERILDRLRNLKICTPEALHNLELQLHRHRLKQAGDTALQLSQRERLAPIQKAWNHLPGKWQKEPELVLAYAQQLADNFEDQEAELQLRKVLAKEWRPEMMGLYGRLRSGDPRAQLRVAEDLLANHPEDAQLLLALGRLNLRNQLWGKARDYFKKSFESDRNVEACTELARLLEQMGERQQSNDYYQLALGLTLPSLPDLPLPKRAGA